MTDGPIMDLLSPKEEGERIASVWRDMTGCGDGEHQQRLAKEIEETIEQAVLKSTERIDKAVDLAFRYGGIEGDHHRAWTIDQMLRILLGDRYQEAVRESCAGEDGPNTYEHDVGIAP